MAQSGLRSWREVKGRPVQGNSPNDRILRGPDCNRPKRVCADSFPATPQPLPKTQTITGRRFPRQGGIYRSDVVLKTIKDWGRVPPPVGRPRGPDKGRDGRSAPCSSSTMSSDRLFLDRVARQHCPSPLHRHGQTNTHSLPASSKPDISTLLRVGHFYFALTAHFSFLEQIPLFGADQREARHAATWAEAPFPSSGKSSGTGRDRSRARVCSAAGEPLTDPSRSVQSGARERGPGFQGARPLAKFEAAPHARLPRRFPPSTLPGCLIFRFAILPESSRESAKKTRKRKPDFSSLRLRECFSKT